MSMQYSRRFDHHWGRSSPENASFSNRRSYSVVARVLAISKNNSALARWDYGGEIGGPARLTRLTSIAWGCVNLCLVNPENPLSDSLSNGSDLLCIEELFHIRWLFGNITEREVIFPCQGKRRLPVGMTLQHALTRHDVLTAIS